MELKPIFVLHVFFEFIVSTNETIFNKVKKSLKLRVFYFLCTVPILKNFLISHFTLSLINVFKKYVHKK